MSTETRIGSLDTPASDVKDGDRWEVPLMRYMALVVSRRIPRRDRPAVMVYITGWVSSVSAPEVPLSEWNTCFETLRGVAGYVARHALGRTFLGHPPMDAADLGDDEALGLLLLRIRAHDDERPGGAE